ncbi:hypothetical protein PVK06_040278 [Gossypium arboreum]|uniref:Uncharacterized protein n=1 Tax=Gossypium arboreum TaxID=29729 RepID=A0ABR0N509_GOSAR|nr:hypothetical protein PVK06_040278 [Gossypium arboreum]
MAHTATLRPPHGLVMCMAMPSSTTQSCLVHVHSHGRPHARVVSIVIIFTAK